MTSRIKKVTVYSGRGKDPMIIPEGENPLPETDLSSNNDKRWPEGTPSEKALRRIVVRSEIRNERKPEPSHRYRKHSKTDQRTRVTEPRAGSSTSDRTWDECNEDTVEALQQQVLDLKKKLKKNKRSRRSQHSSRPKIRIKPERYLSSESSSRSAAETNEEEISDGRNKGGRGLDRGSRGNWSESPSMGPMSLRWFNRLPHSSIYSWNELAEAFVSRFITNSRKPKEFDSLMSMRMKDSESLKNYSARYWEVYNEVDGGTEDMAIKTFKEGLHPESELRHSLSKRSARSMRDLMSRNRIICTGGRRQSKNWGNIYTKSTPKKAQQYEAKKGRNPTRRDPNKYCSYHREKGHMTEKCYTLKKHLEDLAKAGHLHRYISDGQRQHYHEGPTAAHNTKPAARVIETIHTSRPNGQSYDRMRFDLKKAQLLREIFQVSEGSVMSKKPRMDFPRSEQQIFFSDEDLRDVQTPHDDPLVIKLRIGDSNVKRVLIDQGSCSEIMYLDLFHGLGLKQSDLQSYDAPLFGFSGESTQPMGRITLTVHTGPISLETEFIVIKLLPSSASWPPSSRIPQGLSRKGKWQHNAPKAYREKYFKIDRELSPVDRTELIDFLTNNVDVFAWDPYEVPGVDPNYIEHRLNIDPHSKPMQQKARRSAPVHAEAVQKEVERLLQAGAIREIQYPTWLSNTVVVKKKNRKWRVCVDFTNLNQACPKDPFPLPKIDQLVNATAGHDRMSFLDAFQGYHQIALLAEDREKPPSSLRWGYIATRSSQNHLKDLTETFRILRLHKLRLNASKCVFGVRSGKFLGFMGLHRGIEANPDQIKAIRELKAPQTHKEVQRLTGMTAALSRFISRSADRCQPFFQLLKKGTTFKWDDNCISAFEDLKKYLSSSLLMSNPTPSEPLFLYLAVSDRAVLANFVAEFTPTSEQKNIAETTSQEDSPEHTGWWKIYVDGASNAKGSGTGVVTITPDETVIEQSICLDFKTSNNEAEYEAVLAGLNSAKTLGARHLIVYCDSLLVASQINGEYMARDEHALAKLASVLSADFKRFIPIETLITPSIALPTSFIYTITVGPCWMDPYVLYLKEGVLPEQKKEAEIIRRKAVRFWLSKDLKLYKRSFSGPYLLCIHPDIVEDLLYEIHEGICGSHTGDRSLAHRALTQGYWWPYMFGIPKTIISDNETQFTSKPFTKYCSELGIKNVYSSPAYPQSNGQAEASNKTVLDGIKKRLEDAKGRWVKELPNVLWTFRTMPRRSTGETPFSLAYGSEAVIPLEIGLPTLRTSKWEPTRNDLAQSQALDLLEERREQAMIRLASYQQQLKKGYNKNVRPRSFQQGDLVLRRVLGNTKNPTDGKLGPNWEGPYRVSQEWELITWKT
uniref:Integrase catalytic domain-containing protein n=1 Tax=Fagus sylvatica TaxID=28930 RepID=A0A2N9GE01_FAGSY